MATFVPNKTRGQSEVKKTTNIFVFRWCDERGVTMLTTDRTFVLLNSSEKDPKTGKPVKKAEAVVDYTLNVHQVDERGMQMSLSKGPKW